MNGPLRLRIEPGDANESWKRSEGRVVAERFQLLSYLAGSDDSAVFLTSLQMAGGKSKEAAIKLMYAAASDAEKQLAVLKSARELNHPNLIRVFEVGRCEIAGRQLLYVVQEYAEENLSQVLPERALTPEEVREMLPPILDALQYLHGKGFAHGHLQPSNILAIADQVKLSSDALVPLGDKGHGAGTVSAYDPPEGKNGAVSPASDIWQLGMTLIEVLTQQLPAWDRARPGSLEIPRSVPEPFRELTRNCLQADPTKRSTIAQILGSLDQRRSGVAPLESPLPALALVSNEKAQSERVSRDIVQSQRAAPVSATSGEQRTRAKWPYVLLIAAVVAVLFLIARPKSSNPKSSIPPAEVQSTQAQQPAPAGGTQSATSESGQVSPPPERGVGGQKVPVSASESDVVKRILPEVNGSARRTIHGTIVVRVKVQVDAAGNVQQANIESGRVSRYFSRIAVEAAREWKFSPAQSGEIGDRHWVVKFGFSRANTEASAARAKS
jgi:serine/threonine-protein kinase